MVRSKSHIKFEVDQKIRLEKERVKLQMELMEYEARLEKEILDLEHRHFMEEAAVYKEILPMVQEILKLQKELGVKGSVVGFSDRQLEALGRGIIKGLSEEERNRFLRRWR